jgi:hypothetical protein
MSARPKASLVAAMTAVLAIALAGAAQAQPTGHADHPPAPAVSAAKATPLSDTVKAAVEEALQDERRGEGMYARVLKDHGEVRPFSNVVHAERRHAEFLEDLLKAHGLAVPASPAGAEAPAYASVKEACAAAVEFETKNVALYDRLIAAGPLPEDVKQAFDHNRMASADHHKPAFERCSGVVSAQGQGLGTGRGHGCRAGRGAGRQASGNECGRG